MSENFKTYRNDYLLDGLGCFQVELQHPKDITTLYECWNIPFG